MHKFVFYNREILSNSEINLPAASSAALYGRGVFTTLAISRKKTFLWEKHARRLNENEKNKVTYQSNFSEKSVVENLSELIRKNEISNARARLTFFNTSVGSHWTTESTIKTSLLI